MGASSFYNSTQMAPWLEALVKAAGEQSAAISREPYHAYNRERVAPFSKEQMEAQNLSRQTGQYQPFFNEANTLLGRSGESFPQAYQRYKNPYDEAVVNRIGEMGGRTFREQILPALGSTFSRLGQWGSSQHDRLAQRAARDLQENILAQQTQANRQGYNDSARMHEADRMRALQAAEGMQNLGRYTQGARLADISTLQNVGQQQQGLQQQNLDVAYNDFLRQRSFPRAQLSEHTASVQGLPHSNLTYGRESSPNVLQYPNPEGRPNTLSNIGNLAGQLFGMGRMGRKEGGSVKESSSVKAKKKKPLLGGTSLNTSSFVRQPKVGGKTVIPKRIV